MKFYCDVMLGKLAKKLRMLGIDTRYSRTVTAAQLSTVSEGGQRTILTRRRSIATFPKAVPCYFVTSNHPEEQVKEIIKQFNLSSNDLMLFSICILCNCPLEKIHKSLVQGSVPDYVFNTVTDFSQCPGCKKIYWRGSHYRNMRKALVPLKG